jgi:hypothetical protein
MREPLLRRRKGASQPLAGLRRIDQGGEEGASVPIAENDRLMLGASL